VKAVTEATNTLGHKKEFKKMKTTNFITQNLGNFIKHMHSNQSLKE